MHLVEIPYISSAPNVKLLRFSVVISWLHLVSKLSSTLSGYGTTADQGTGWRGSLCMQKTWRQSSGWLLEELDGDVSQACREFRKVEPAWSGGARGAHSVMWAGCSCPWELPSRAAQTWPNSLSNSDFLFKVVNNHTQKWETQSWNSIAQEKVSWGSFKL